MQPSRDRPGVYTETAFDIGQSEELKHRFSRLQVEETSDRFQEILEAPDIDQSLRTEVKNGPRYEVEPVIDKREPYVAAHCFFQDVWYFFQWAEAGWAAYMIDSRSLKDVTSQLLFFSHSKSGIHCYVAYGGFALRLHFKRSALSS